jgi:glycosyltransferase involved in cell wall biosynthesis
MKPAVLQLIDSFDEGGSERQALELTRLLRNSGRFEVFLATLKAEGVLRKEIADLNLEPIPAYPLTSFYDTNAARQLRRFVAYLRANRIDVLHTHDFYTNVFGMAAASLARMNVRIASCRETDGMRSRGQQRLQRVAFKFADRVVANSSSVKQKLIGEGIRAHRVAVIHNGLNIARIQTNQPVDRAQSLSVIGLNNAPRNIDQFVTIVANMRHEVKNYPMFLQVARRVCERMQNVGFLLAGEGPLQSSLKELSRQLGVAEKSFFLGRCEQIAELLSVSNVCLLTSTAEGFSNAILEYMAAARPVVATNVGGASEAVVDGVTGYLVDSGDDKTMAERIIRLLREPELARSVGEAGRMRVEQEFSTTSLLHNVESLYDSLLTRERATQNKVASLSDSWIGSDVR